MKVFDWIGFVVVCLFVVAVSPMLLVGKILIGGVQKFMEVFPDARK